MLPLYKYLVVIILLLQGIACLSQCPGIKPYISLEAADTVICIGDSVTIIPQALSGVALYESFNDGTLDYPEFSTATPVSSRDIGTSCYPGLDGTACYYSGGNDSITGYIPAHIATIDLDMTGGGFITFDFRYDDVTNTSPYCNIQNPPGFACAGLGIQYSTNSGNTWIDTLYFRPYGDTLVSATPSYLPAPQPPLSDDPFYQWRHYIFPVPFSARVPCVRFRWVQLSPAPCSPGSASDGIVYDNLFIGDTATATAYWPFGNPFGYPTDTAFTIAPTQDTLLVLAMDTGTAPYITTFYDTVFITVKPLPDAELAFSAPACAGDTVHFSATPKGPGIHTDYDLDNTGGYNYFDAPEDTAFVYLIPGTYSIRVRSFTAAGCYNADTFQLEVYASPQLSLAGNPLQACEGEPVNFYANAQLQNPPSQNSQLSVWNWDFNGNGTTDSTGGSILDSLAWQYSQFGNYTAFVTVSTNNGCSATDSIQIVVKEKPTASFAGGNKCFPALIQFNDNSAITSDTIAGWQWHFANNAAYSYASTMQNPAIQVPASGAYTATLVVTSSNGCSDSLTKPFTVFPLPTANFTYKAECFGITDFSQTVAQGTPPYYFTWDLQNDQFPDTTAGSFRFQYQNTADTSITVHFSVTDANGCQNDTLKTIPIKGGIDSLIMPNILILNSTVAGNDRLNFQTFAPGFNDCVSYTLRIYNRWGALVFATENRSATPDMNCSDCFVGKTMQGAELSNGVYYYVLHGTDPTGKDYAYSGALQVVDAE